MPMVYDRAYKVPVWVLINTADEKKKEKLVQLLTKEGAKLKQWPAPTFAECILSYRKKGYYDHLPQEYPFFVDPSLLLRAAQEHLKAVISQTSYLGGAFKHPANRLDRKVESDASFERLFNSLLDLEEPIGLSQIFQVAEDCHSEGPRNFSVFVTTENAPKSLLTKIANKVITIGDGEENDIVIKEAKISELKQVLSKIF